MPLYTYKCKNCGNVVEKFHKMSSNAAEKCEECGSETVRVFLPTGIIFKGSGFYSTDYKSGTSKANLNTGSAGGEKKEEHGQEKKDTQKVEHSSSKNSETARKDKDKN